MRTQYLENEAGDEFCFVGVVRFVVIVENFSFFRQAHWFGGDEKIPILWSEWRAKR
jgi:hypothetical protein